MSDVLLPEHEGHETAWEVNGAPPVFDFTTGEESPEPVPEKDLEDET